MPKITKKTTISLNGKTHKDLPFLGYRFENMEEALSHPAIAGRIEPVYVKNEDGKEREQGLSVVGLLNYAFDLKERPKVKSVWTDRIIGPDKALLSAAKDVQKAAASMGGVLTLQDALSKVKIILGVVDSDKKETDLTSPVDSEPLMVDSESDLDSESESEEVTA